jgi:hypothetical protein
MRNPSNFAIALETWKACSEQLPQDCGWSVAAHPKDPSPLNKKGNAPFVTRLRILPETKHPNQFWSSSWCFYEILIGPVDGGTNLGGVQFLQFSNQAVCGDGLWHQPVMQVLKALQQERPMDFSLTEFNDRHVRKPQLCTRYRMSPKCRAFPVDRAAADLAWLIQKSMPKFQALRLGASANLPGTNNQI